MTNVLQDAPECTFSSQDTTSSGLIPEETGIRIQIQIQISGYLLLFTRGTDCILTYVIQYIQEICVIVTYLKTRKLELSLVKGPCWDLNSGHLTLVTHSIPGLWTESLVRDGHQIRSKNKTRWEGQRFTEEPRTGTGFHVYSPPRTSQSRP